MACKFCDEYSGICTNPESPMRADCCPVPDTDGVCRFEDREEEVYELTPNGCATAVQRWTEAKTMPKKTQALVFDLANDDFGAVLNCAVRYAIGRQSYMPSLVIDFITPLLPYLNNRTLWCFDQDVTNARWEGGYGDPDIDEPGWMKFHEAVRAERVRRGDQPYVSWRERA